MPDLKPPIFLTPQYSVIARTGIAPSTFTTWEPHLWREPRLLVPIDVQALVVTADSAETWADVARRLPEGAEPREGSKPQEGALDAPPPFTDLAARTPGVYLHWALPDALATGAAAHTPGETVPGQLGMRPVPNRWLVARVGGGVPRRVTAWVVEADRAVTTVLADWREQAAPSAQARTPWLQPSSLTAVTGGDPAWAAIYDGVVDRFAVHDDLAGLDPGDASGTLSYLVVGWYSDSSLDPLAGADAAGGFEALLAQLRWSVDPEALRRARAEADAMRAAAAAARKPTAPRAPAGDVVGSLRVGAVETRVPLESGVDRRLVEGGHITLIPTAWSPRQLLCHGLVHGVRPDGRGGDDRPRVEDVATALGSSAEESFAALLGAPLPDPRGAERLTTAFLRGLAGRFDDPDGAVVVDEDLHGAEFVALPGGTRANDDRVRDSAPTAGVIDALAQNAAARTRGIGGKTTTAGAREKVTLARGEAVLETFHARLRDGGDGGGGAAAAQPSTAPQFRDVTVGLPRFYVPTDPVLTLVGAGRSLRHGGDGNYTADGTLACRLTGEPGDRLHGVLDGPDAVAPLGSGSIPPECDPLLAELVLSDPFHADDTVSAAARRAGGETQPLRARVLGEIALSAAASQNADVTWPAGASTVDGTFPSPRATTWWRQPWVPLYVEWELALDLPDDDAAALDAWQLAEVDLDPAADAPAPATTQLTLTGRSLLTPAPASNFAARVTETLNAEAQAQGGGELEPATENALRTLAARSTGLDVTAAAFDRLRMWLLGWDDMIARARADAPDASPLPTRLPRLVRSGAFTVTRARIVDAFGRVVDLTPRLTQTRIATSLTADGSGATAAAGMFVPRITAPARLMLRLVAPGREDVEAYVDQDAGSVSPVAGFVLPDYVDHAAELFDAEGEPLGQLLNNPDGPGVLWESAPGKPGPLGAPPPIRGPADLPLAGLVTGLLAADAERRSAGPVPETEDLLEEEESPLSALLRVLDTTATTVDPSAGGTEHLSGLVGRPLALVRALLRVDVAPDPAPAETPEPLHSDRARAVRELARVAVPVRLGELTRLTDGLLGFYVDDDYTRFHPVDGEVLATALDSGPRRGALAAGADPTDAPTRPITSPFVVADPVLHVHPGQTLRLTLVVVPGTSVHATCGVVPRTSVRLQRDWAAQALEKIEPSFRIGPVLVDPTKVQMPAPGGRGLKPSWAHRDTPITWRDDPIAAAGADAQLPDKPAQVQEGWIRIQLAKEDGS